ncbi:unnamed protein product, partial [Prorocentrum cordatum]
MLARAPVASLLVSALASEREPLRVTAEPCFTDWHEDPEAARVPIAVSRGLLCTERIPASEIAAVQVPPDACEACLERGPAGAPAADALRGAALACAGLPAVLYLLEPPPRPGGQPLAACARAACPLPTLLACVLWEALVPLLPFQVAGRGATSQAPGVPPFGRHLCAGPHPGFYRAAAVLPAHPPAHRCGSIRFLPISFGIPKEDIVACLPSKATSFAPLRPGHMSTYIFPISTFGELEYKRMYREARFALCPKKWGWETMRLYEILANGCIPILGDLQEVPRGALAFLDRALLARAASFSGLGNLQISTSTELPPEPKAGGLDERGYTDAAAELLRHTQQRLTTEAMARYLLAASGLSSSSAVLFLANCGHGDYQCYLCLHGLRQVLGSRLVDVPRLEYMYRPARLAPMGGVDRQTVCPQGMCAIVSGSSTTPVIRGEGAPVPIYGGGFSYAFRLEDVPMNRSEDVIAAGIRRGAFDAVVVGSAQMLPADGDRLDRRRGKRLGFLWKLVQQHYAPQRVVIVDGRDPPADDHFHEGVRELAGRGFRYFLREIPGAAAGCEEEPAGAPWAGAPRGDRGPADAGGAGGLAFSGGGEKDRWYIQQQMETEYLPKSKNWCVYAEYSRLANKSFWGYDVRVHNYAEEKDGTVHDSDKNIGGAGILAKIVDEKRGQLEVAPYFLPTFLAGPYWILDYNEQEGYTLVSG